jgi:tetratricopeptide (TPR) repeat protein
MTGREDIFQQVMNEGHSAAWDQMWEKAAGCYQKALEEFPDNVKALNSLGLALFQLQRYEESLEIYKRVIRVAPDDAIAMEKIAQLSERLGNIPQAVQAALQAAELYLRSRDVEKAIENWSRVTQLSPENLAAHSRLAMVHEKMGQIPQAVASYIAVASLWQHNGDPQKAMEIVQHILQLAPDSPEAKQAYGLLRAGQMLPKPIRPRGGTGPLRMAQIKQLEAPKKSSDSGLNPIEEARQKAVMVLAEILFEFSDESPEAQNRRGLQSLMRGTGALNQSQETKIVLYLSQAIDSQSKNQEAQAAEELERALDAGFNIPPVYFDLGYLHFKTEHYDNAFKFLQQTIRHNDYGMAARLLCGLILRKAGKVNEAAVEYLEALKLADSSVVPPEQADSIRQLYEPLVEAQANEKDSQNAARLCDNVQGLIVRANWRDQVSQARTQLPKTPDDSVLPLAEVLIQAQSSQVLEEMNNINQLARAGQLRSAMDQAYYALVSAPTYLPLHTLIGDLLIREGRTQDAIAKFSVVAQAYGVRGEASQATTVLRRILQLAPMDLAVRTLLIEQLIARGQVDEAISEYIELADIYYRLAELDMARKTYTTALRVAQQSNANSQWNVQVLHRMADIDLQRLDWRQALRVYEQIKTLRADDEPVRKHLIEINLRLAQAQQASIELENYLSYLESNRRSADAIKFAESLLEEHGNQVFVRKALAGLYQKTGRTTDAIAQLDAAGEVLMETGNKVAVAEIVTQILMMNPPNSADYRELLKQLQN